MFDKYIPKLDLHGETSDIAKILVNEFIEDNYKLQNKRIEIIHGIGTRTLKNIVHEVLKKNKLVDSFKLDNFNEGCTIINLKQKT